MTTPIRPWREEGAPPEMRELLDSSRIDEPTEQQLGELTQKLGLLFTLPPGGGGGGSGPAGDGGATGGAGPGPAAPAAGGGGAAVATTSVATKVLVGALAVASVGGAVWTGAAVLRPAPVREPAAAVVTLPPPAPPVAAPEPVSEAVAEAPPPPPPAPTRRAEPPRARPREPSEPVAEPAAPAPAPAPAEPARASPPPAPAAPSSDDELTLLEEAHNAAQAGRPQEVLAAVEQHTARFPQGAMAQEREVLAIEALVSLERRAEARARVERFRARWPTSSHLLHLETLVQSN